jgi:hypothetical protein
MGHVHARETEIILGKTEDDTRDQSSINLDEIYNEISCPLCAWTTSLCIDCYLIYLRNLSVITTPMTAIENSNLCQSYCCYMLYDRFWLWVIIAARPGHFLRVVR